MYQYIFGLAVRNKALFGNSRKLETRYIEGEIIYTFYNFTIQKNPQKNKKIKMR